MSVEGIFIIIFSIIGCIVYGIIIWKLLDPEKLIGL